MTKRERVLATFNREPIDRTPFWKGHPTAEKAEVLCNYFGIQKNTIDLSLALNDDMVWIYADDYCWHHPEGKPMLDVNAKHAKKTLGDGGSFANISSVEELEDFEWPNPDYLKFDTYREVLQQARDKNLAVAGGFWAPFFHNIADFLGMEEYFINMHTHPEIVEALTNKVVDLYIEANRRCFEAVGDLIDIYFFGNDLGTQRDLFISPEMFDAFVLPSIKRLTALAKSYGKKVMLHSCGSIYRIIPSLIEAGIDALHPLQAQAAHMSAEELVQYTDKLILVGGIDTQDLLPNGTPEEVAKRVAEVKQLLSPALVVSPSHEALQRDVPTENVIALSEAATGEKL